MKRLLAGAVRFYRRHISVHLPARCKYYPTCSTYALTCIERHGALKGAALSGWRLLRCNPLSNGGVDYPPLPGRWGAAPYHQMSDAELASHWARLDQAQAADQIRGISRQAESQARKGI